MKKFVFMITISLLTISMFSFSVMATNDELPQMRANACPQCNGGGLVETVGPLDYRTMYMNCPFNPGYLDTGYMIARTYTFICNKCRYTTSYTEAVQNFRITSCKGPIRHTDS